jgi:dTDP-4-amino-4,6-dideoxygalactose transaminase
VRVDRFTAKVPSWYYEVVAPGYKYNLTDIAAALGIHQLKQADAFAQRRSHIAQQYDAGLASLPLVTPPHAPAGDRHAWHLYPIRLTDEALAHGLTRDQFIERLYAAGIGASVHYIPLHEHPYWRDRYSLTPAMFPHSQHAYERLVSLPIYTLMTDADVQRVLRAVRLALAA